MGLDWGGYGHTLSGLWATVQDSTGLQLILIALIVAVIGFIAEG